MIYQSDKYKILDVIEQPGDNILIRIKTGLNPKPGQFVEVSVPGIGECPISSASYNKKILDLSVRIVGNVTNAISGFQKGSKIHLRGPYGKGFPMNEIKGKNLILIGGGCGVAPLRGTIEYIDQNRLDYKEIFLFFGFRNPEEVLFKEEIQDWQKRYHTNLSVDEVVENNPFNCPVGYVTSILEKYDLPRQNTEILMCGPPMMMDKSVEILKGKGFHSSQIWLSFERHMKCVTGKCGHCMINSKYLCIDGPVFRYDEVMGLDD